MNQFKIHKFNNKLLNNNSSQPAYKFIYPFINLIIQLHHHKHKFFSPLIFITIHSTTSQTLHSDFVLFLLKANSLRWKQTVMIRKEKPFTSRSFWWDEHFLCVHSRCAIVGAILKIDFYTRKKIFISVYTRSKKNWYADGGKKKFAEKNLLCKQNHKTHTQCISISQRFFFYSL